MQRSGDAGGNTWLYTPIRNSSIKECEKYSHSKTTCPDLFHMQKDYATRISPQMRIRKRKKLYGTRTALRNNSTTLNFCTICLFHLKTYLLFASHLPSVSFYFLTTLNSVQSFHHGTAATTEQVKMFWIMPCVTSIVYQDFWYFNKKRKNVLVRKTSWSRNEH